RSSVQSSACPIHGSSNTPCCESSSEERSARNPHATFCGSRRWVTAVGDPVLTPCLRVSRCLPHQKKANKPWIWIAMDATPRQVIAFHVGDRSRESGNALWANIPLVYREQATFHTDQYEVYKGVIPAEQHRAITKKARKTNHIERFNNTLRQRVSRLVRETLSFSKKLTNHIGAIKYFICHYNLTKVAALPV